MIFEVDILLPPEYKISQQTLNAASNRIMEKVRPIVEEKFREAITEYVYSYGGGSYVRRYSLISDPYSTSISGGIMSMSATASSNPWGYSVSGQDFLWALHNPGPLWTGRFPRPADPDAYQEYIDNSKEIEDAIEKEIMAFIATLR